MKTVEGEKELYLTLLFAHCYLRLCERNILGEDEGMKLLNAIKIKSHTDCLAVFVLEFVVKKKTIFSIKGENVFIMFYISINSKKTDSKIIIAAHTGYAMGSLYHKRT